MNRPSEEAAREAIEKFLTAELGECPHFHLVEDGETSWAFWVLPDDTTSYLAHDHLARDLRIQWHGTDWTSASEDDDEDTVDVPPAPTRRRARP